MRPMQTTHTPHPSQLTTEPTRPEGPLTISVPEAGTLLGISRALAYELAARGELPTLRLGRRLVVPRAALLAMVEVPVPGAA